MFGDTVVANGLGQIDPSLATLGRLNPARWSGDRSLQAARKEILEQDGDRSFVVSMEGHGERHFDSAADAAVFLHCEIYEEEERRADERRQQEAVVEQAQVKWLNSFGGSVLDHTEAWVALCEAHKASTPAAELCGSCDGLGCGTDGCCQLCKGCGLVGSQPKWTWHVQQFLLDRATSWLASHFQKASGKLLTEMLDVFHTRQGHFAAFAAAAYEPGSALQTLQENGVLSENWTIDRELSSEFRTIFVNSLTGQVVQAERGTDRRDASVISDYVTDASIVVGEEEHSKRFRESAAVLQQVISKYGKKNLCTGHSLGGGVAWLLGERTGVEAYGYNPGMGVRALMQNKRHFRTNLHMFRNSRDPASFVAKTNVNMTSLPDATGGRHVHGVAQFLQSPGNVDQFLMAAAKVITVAAASAKLSADVTSLLINSLVSKESRMTNDELHRAAGLGVVYGVAVGTAAGGAAAAVGGINVAVQTTVAAPGVWGWLGYTTTTVTTSSVATTLGCTQTGMACAAAVPVAAATAALVVYRQFGRVTLSEALEEWRQCQPKHRIARDSLFFEGSVQDDLKVPAEIKGNGWWKGFGMATGVIAFKTECNALTSQFVGAYNMAYHSQEHNGELLGYIWLNNCKIKVRSAQ